MFKSLFLYLVVKPEIALAKAVIEVLLMMCADGRM